MQGCELRVARLGVASGDVQGRLGSRAKRPRARFGCSNERAQQRREAKAQAEGAAGPARRVRATGMLLLGLLAVTELVSSESGKDSLIAKLRNDLHDIRKWKTKCVFL